MPAVLSDRKICHPHVPLAWKSVLDGLQEFQRLEKQLHADPGNESLAEEVLELHEQLVGESSSLLEPHALDDLTERQVAEIFARSVFLLMRIASSVAADDDVLDTAGSQTLRLYEADFLADRDNQECLRQALRLTCELDEPALRKIETVVEDGVREAERTQTVVRAIRDHFGLWTGRPQLRSDIGKFFHALYPHVALAENEIQLIVTGTMIFFCLPFENDELTTARFANLNADEQQPIRDFLTRVNQFKQWQFAHFPVFGYLRGEDLDARLLEQLAVRCEMETAEVARRISALTAIIPLQEVDKYVVHDVWGHSWQASMLQFDKMYQQLATFADPLSLEELATDPAADRLRFADCFVGHGDDLDLHEDTFRRFVDLEVAERLPIAMTPVLAEVLADVAEFKLLATDRTDHLPSSSVLKKFPAKLDLTMRDVVYYFRQATKVFRLWAARADRKQRTIQELIRCGGAPQAAERAVEKAVRVWQALESDRLAPQLIFRAHGDSLHVNVLSRVALNFLAIHREILLAYRRIGPMHTGQLPLTGFRDLLLISVAVFFEDSPSRNLWRVDEFLSLRIEPLCERLAAVG